MAKQHRSLSGQVAAVTGGARGIGRATAAALAREGVRVAIGDLDATLAEQAASAAGGGAIGLRVDVSDRESFSAFLDEAEAKLGPLDILVNNAGVMHLGRFVDEDDTQAIRQVDINLHGVIFGSKLALARFERRGRGHLVNIASTAGKTGIPGGATYSATKHAVVGLSEAIRGEVHGSDIEVSVVMPGVVNTEFADGLAKGRAVKVVEPTDVADAIVAALKVPHFDVFVPKAIGSIMRGNALLPRRVNEAIGRALKTDRILAGFDRSKRAGYEARAQRS